MKKTKIGLIIATVLLTIAMIIVTLLLISTVSFGGGDSEWQGLWKGGLQWFKGSSGTNYGFAVNDVTAAKYNNIYCIEHGGVLRSGYKTISGTSGVDACRYFVRVIVELNGDEGRYKLYKNGAWSERSDTKLE